MCADSDLLELLPLPHRMLLMLWCVLPLSSPHRSLIANHLEYCEVRVLSDDHL